MRITLIIISSVLIAMSLLLIIVSPVAGIIMTLFGIALLLYGIKWKKPEVKPLHNYEPVLTASMFSKNDAADDGYYTIPVAGFDYHQPELRSLLRDYNELYDSTKKEMLECCDIDESIYQYYPEEYPLHIQAEPDNPHDPHAVKVYAGDVFVGYVPRGRFGDVKECMTHNPKCCVRIIGGKYKCLEHDYDADCLGSFDDKYIKVKTYNSPTRAMMVFKW